MDQTHQDAQAAGDAAYTLTEGGPEKKSAAYTRAYARVMAAIEKDNFARHFFERLANGEAEIINFTAHRCPECDNVVPTGNRCAHCDYQLEA